jgi:hypothetical protein
MIISNVGCPGKHYISWFLTLPKVVVRGAHFWGRFAEPRIPLHTRV